MATRTFRTPDGKAYRSATQRRFVLVHEDGTIVKRSDDRSKLADYQRRIGYPYNVGMAIAEAEDRPNPKETP